MSESKAKSKSNESPKPILKQAESSKSDLPQHIKERLAVSMGPANAPVLQDMFGDDDLGRQKGSKKFFSFTRVGDGVAVESVEFVGMRCGHCGNALKANAETEMDYMEPTEEHLLRLCHDELEGR